jgi:transposase
VPGVGVVTVASLLGEAGDLSRYDDWRQLRKLAGYNLKENSSGTKQGRTKITKRGRPGLRCLLYQAAMVLVARNAQFKALYQHLKNRSENPLKGKQALVAVACKLIRVLFTLAQKKRHYDAATVSSALPRSLSPPRYRGGCNRCVTLGGAKPTDYLRA